MLVYHGVPSVWWSNKPQNDQPWLVSPQFAAISHHCRPFLSSLALLLAVINQLHNLFRWISTLSCLNLHDCLVKSPCIYDIIYYIILYCILVYCIILYYIILHYIILYYIYIHTYDPMLFLTFPIQNPLKSLLFLVKFQLKTYHFLANFR